MFKKPGAYKIILAFIAILLTLVAILIFFAPPTVIPDPASGFMVMRSMQMGSGFNIMVGPTTDDISKNASYFQTWWSPGQYLVPWAFKYLLSINIGQGSIITIILSNISGLAGFYFFFKKLGFTKMIAAVSLLFIMCQQLFWITYTFYNGGETLLFAFEGWFLYGCVALKRTDAKLLIFILISGPIGALCKLSFMWIYAAGILSLWISLSLTQKNVYGWIKKGLWVGIPAILSVGLIYFFFLSKGTNPASVTGNFKLSTRAIGFPLASPLLSGFSLDDLMNGLIAPDGPPMFNPTQTIVILLSLALLSVGLVLALARYVPNSKYRIFILTFYGVSLLFFWSSYLRQAVISYEARHFRLIGLLIVPGLIYLVSRLKLAGQFVFVLICLFIANKGLRLFIAMYEDNLHAVHGASGFALPNIDQPSLNYIRTLDRQNTNAIFVSQYCDNALEIFHNRVIPLEDNPDTFQGHGGPIYILFPSSFTSDTTKQLLKHFPGYANFTSKALSKDYILYSAQ